MHNGKPKLTNKNCNHRILSSKEDNSLTNAIHNRGKIHRDDDITLKYAKMSKLSKSRARTYRGVISIYSKLHFRDGLKYDSLFLATDIFQSYMEKQAATLSKEKLVKISLACFMMAIKIQEIYPPSLEQIASYFKLSEIDLEEYIDLQFMILEKLGFTIDFYSPIRYLFDKQANLFPHLQNLNRKQMFKVYLFLEIALNDPTVFSSSPYKNNQKIPWKMLMKAINLIYSPLVQNTYEEIDVVLCAKKLILAKSNLQNAHPFLFNKYKSEKYGYASLLHTYQPSKQYDQQNRSQTQSTEQEDEQLL